VSPIGIVLVVLLILILFGAVGGPYLGASWTTGYGYSYGGVGVIGVILIIVLILALTGRF
jgi:uncharacterized protein (DUF697 family)